MKKIALFLTFFLLFVQNSYAKNVEDVFSDIGSDYKYLNELQALFDKGIIKESDDALFGPKALLKRDDFAGIVTEVSCTKCIKPQTDASLIDKYSDSTPFFDVNKSNKNFYCIAESYAKGAIKGYDKGHECSNGVSRDGESPFCPQNFVTREEALAILLRNSTIFSTYENNLIKEKIAEGRITNPIGKDVFPKESGTVNTFYGYFLKASDYVYEDKKIDSDGNVTSSNYKIIEPDAEGYYKPDAYITKEDYLRMAFVVFKSNSCNFEDVWDSDIASSINIYDLTCTPEKSPCSLADLNKKATIYDFEANYKITEGTSKESDVKWVFTYLGDSKYGYDQVKYGDYVDNYNFRDKAGNLLPGKWVVTLIVKDSNGNVSTSETELNISSEKSLPKVNIEASPISGVGPLKVDFSGIGGEEGTKYEWDFGDGNTGIGKNGENVYKKPGTYKVKLKAISKDGVVTESYMTVKVFDKNEIDVDGEIIVKESDISIKASPDTGVGPLDVDFTGVGGEAGTKYEWNFGDGNTGTGKNANNVYKTPGTYNVKLKTTSKDGKVTESSMTVRVYDKVGISASPESGVGPLDVDFTGIGGEEGTKYEWNFGDGNTGTGKNANNVYKTPGTYNVKLKATSKDGKVTESSMTVRVYDKIGISASPESGVGPLDVDFSGIGGEEGTKYEWNFGDGNTGTGKNANNVYKTPGTYSVKLKATSKDGKVTESSMTVRVYDKIGISASPESGVGPLDVDFSGIGGEEGTKYEWSFGDGNTGTGKNANNVYKTPGTYNVKLKATSKYGTVTESSMTVRVYDKDNVNVDGEIDEKIINSKPFNVDFDYKNTAGDKSLINRYERDFGDGTKASGKNSNVGHEFPGPGTYLVTLKTVITGGKNRYHSYYVTIGADGIITDESFVDSDGDGVFDNNDLCPLVKGPEKNKGCPILSQSCTNSSSCSDGYVCDTGVALCVKDSDGDGVSDVNDKCVTFPGPKPDGCPEKYSSCLNQYYSKIVGSTTCTTCPCNIDIKFDSDIRECDILFPAILSEDGKDIFSKGSNYEIKSE